MRRLAWSALVGVLVAAALAGPAPAQEPDSLDRADPRPVAGGLLGAAGVLGGALGILAGAAIGYPIGQAAFGCPCDDAEGAGALLGGAVGWTVGVPLGVHLANGRRGSFGRATLVSLGLAGAGIFLLSTAGDAAPFIAVAVPLAQILGSVAIEQSTAQRERR